jgi:hypothetical protein
MPRFPLRSAALWYVVAAVLAACLLWTTAHVRAKSADDMTSTLIIDGSRIDVTIESGGWKISQDAILHWVKLAGEAVATYYGKYPVPHVTIQINPFDGSGVRHGMTWGRDGGGLIKIGLGTQTPAADLNDEWMLTHEMVHLSFPSVADDHHWMEEGLATYVEPIARIQAGQMPAIQMWTDLARDMRKGVPKPDDKGLDNTHTWASTYWGGALFCFVADVKIREQSNNKVGLQDALRGILNAGGDIREDWKLEDAFQIGDKTVGGTVLTDLYMKMKDNPMPVDLADLWKKLGVESDGKTIHLNDDAPLAAIRRAMTSVDTAKTSQHSDARTPAQLLQPSAVYAGRTRSATRKSES